jgi:hypothetical protein
MSIRSLTVLAAVAILAGVSASTASPAAATAKTKICAQIKHGPHAAYTTLLTHKKLSGTTWTVFATGVPCTSAMKVAPSILKWFPKAKVDAYNFKLNGFLCTKENDGKGSSGSVGCHYHGLSNIELIMTGSYSIAALKRMYYIQ